MKVKGGPTRRNYETDLNLRPKEVNLDFQYCYISFILHPNVDRGTGPNTCILSLSFTFTTVV